MKLIMKYLKPFALAVLVCIGCLFGQVVCDLTLPNKMSDIVNVGIQQGGLEAEAPMAISEKGMQLILLFMTGEEQQLMEQSYQYVLPQSSEALRYAADYPLVKEAPVYIRTTRETIEIDSLTRIYGKASYALMDYIKSMNAEESAASTDLTDGEATQEDTDEEISYADVDVNTLYELIPMLEQLPQEAFSDSIAVAGQMEESMRDQVGIVFTKLFYNEIGIDTDEIQHSYIWNVGIRMIGVALLAGLAAVVVSFIASRVAAKVAKHLRRDLFRKVESFSSAEYDKFSTASLITRTTNDVQQVQMLITMGLRMLCYAPMMGVGSIIFAVSKSSSLSWIIVLTVVMLLGILLVILAVVLPKFKILQKLTDRLNLVSRESLSGMLVIRAFGNEAHEEERFESANKELTDTNMFVQKVMSIVMPGMTFMMNLATLLIVWFGANAIADATLQIGDMMAFIQYAMHVIISFLMIAMMFVFVPRALVSAKRIREVLDTAEEIKDPQTPQSLDTVKGTISFNNVFFRYPGAEENVLEDISFTANPGETTAFIGSTGSGKSTLINLIPRFYEVSEGSITLDGVDIRDLTQEQLRSNIGYIPQKGLLFSGTIASNLQYGKEDATEEDMYHALQVAQAEDFVYSDEEGTALTVSQGGTSVSGGQRQRLSIARALIKRAPIYIFDDSFSALDLKTDANLRRALKQDTSDATVLIVAQRVSTILYAEQIVVLDKGEIVGKGTHRELLETCPEYREIAESQMAKEELA